MEIVIAQWSDLFSNSTRKLENKNKKKTFYHYELTQERETQQQDFEKVFPWPSFVFCGKLKMLKLVDFVCEVILIQINELMRSDLRLLTIFVNLH